VPTSALPVPAAARAAGRPDDGPRQRPEDGPPRRRGRGRRRRGRNENVNNVVVHVDNSGPHGRAWGPGEAAVLSLFVPGLGQMVRGQVGLGIFWLVAVPVGYLFCLLPGFVLHLVCIVTAAHGAESP
jgi:hypothetical protein